MNKFKTFLFRSAIIIAIAFVALELTGRFVLGIMPECGNQGDNFYDTDTILCWKNGKLKHERYTLGDDTSNYYYATTDAKGNRITNSSVTIASAHLPLIQLYGCSYTFGQSVNDTSTFCYRLQQKLPDYRIENKGVRSYGLTQMYLSLQQSLASKDTPVVAIFNYATFQDNRTPVCKQWSQMIKYSISNAKGKDKLTYPYFDLENDSLQLHRMFFKNVPIFWRLSCHSSLIFIINNLYVGIHDDHKIPYFHLISLKTAVEIMEYCKRNHIIPVFANFTFNDPEMPTIPNDMIDSLTQRGYYTLDYGIDIGDKKYNCWPYDRGHPNALAHSIYAEKLFSFLTDNQLLQQNQLAVEQP